MKETAIQIGYRDRPTELAMLLESLYYQTYQDFDIFIRDDASGTLLNNYHFLNCMAMRLKLQGHNIIINRNDFCVGVSKNRQKLVEDSQKYGKYKYFARLDDDVVLERDFLERLIKVINEGYDLASGVTPSMVQPMLKREIVPEIINYTELDEEGNIIFSGDDCGMGYYDDEVRLCPHFRSSALYKVEIHNKVNYLPTKLTKHGFREENIFSWNCIINGYKMAVDTNAVAHHQMTPSGGERFQNSNELIQQNQKIFEEETKKLFKKHGNFLSKYYKDNGIIPEKLTKQQYMIETNLVGKII